MTSQSALLLTKIGKPLEKQQISILRPSQDEIAIKITAAGLAPLDAKLRDKNAFNIGTRLPAVIAGDIVGTVVDNGSHSEFPVGSHVFSQTLFNNPKAGGLQEYTLLNPTYTAIVPPGTTDVEAALYPINVMTSANALFTSQGFDFPWPGTPEFESFDYASKTIVIIGGGSNCGKLGIQLAKYAGWGNIITTASPSGAEELKSYGVTHVIDRHASDVVKQVRAIVGDNLLYVFDTINDKLDLAVSLVSDKQKSIVAFLIGPGGAAEAEKAKKTDVIELKRIQGFSHAFPEFGKRVWKEFPDLLKKGVLKPAKFNVIEGLDADKVNTVLDEYSAGKGGARYHVRLA